MKNKTIIFLSTLLISFNYISDNNVYAQIQNNTINLKGKIVDKETKKPIRNTYIKQIDTLNTVLSDENGNFNIELNKNSKMEILIFKEAYEKIQIKVENKNYIEIEMSSNLKINPDLPKAHTDLDNIFNYSSNPISSMFSAMYQVRHISSSYPFLTNSNKTVNTNGWAINELAIDGRIRLDDWLADLRIFKSRSPIDIEKFTYKPAYYLDLLQVQLSANRVFKSSKQLEFSAGLSYLMNFLTPDNKSMGDNKPIPYTNSGMDFPQSRQGLGVSGGVGYKITDKILFLGNINLYPYLFNSFEGLENPLINYSGLVDTRIALKFETLDGVYISAGYNNQLFFGNNNFKDISNIFNIGLSLDPFKMAGVQPLGTNSLSDNK